MRHEPDDVVGASHYITVYGLFRQRRQQWTEKVLNLRFFHLAHLFTHASRGLRGRTSTEMGAYETSDLSLRALDGHHHRSLEIGACDEEQCLLTGGEVL